MKTDIKAFASQCTKILYIEHKGPDNAHEDDEQEDENAHHLSRLAFPMEAQLRYKEINNQCGETDKNPNYGWLNMYFAVNGTVAAQQQLIHLDGEQLHGYHH